MGNLLRYNLRKLSREKSFYITLGINLALIMLSVLVMVVRYHMYTSDLERDYVESVLRPMLHGTNFFLSSPAQNMFLMLTGIFVAITVCSDFSQRTIRNMYARGYSRLSCYVAKVLTVVIALTVAYAVSMLVSFAATQLFIGDIDGDFGKIAAVIGLQYLTVLASGMFILMLSMLMRKTGGAVASAVLAPNVISLVLLLINEIPALEKTVLAEYWLDTFLQSLSTDAVTTERMLWILGLSLGYIAVFFLIGLLPIRKVEV